MSALVLLFLAGTLAALGGVWLKEELSRFGARLGLFLALVALFTVPGDSAFGGLLVFDPFARVVGGIGIAAALFASLVSPRVPTHEWHALLAYSAFGVLVMASSSNLVVILLGLELLSLPLYALIALRYDELGIEAAVKYFVLGAVAAAVFVLGLALYFGATGTLSLGASASGPLFAAGVVLLLAALLFKVAMVPFGWWAPDVYQGAPTPITLYMAAGVKAPAFAALLKLLQGAGLGGVWAAALAFSVLLAVVFGNLAALAQSEAKRLLAYSAIAHAGYLALALFGPEPAPALGYYLVAYGLSVALAFLVLAQLDRGEGVPLEDLSGLIKRSPLLAGALLLALFSLAGVPPFVGFWGKYLAFFQAAQGGQYLLVVVALLTAVVAAYYYLRLAAFAFFLPPKEKGALAVDPLVAFLVGLLAFLVVALGFFPGALAALF